MPAKKPEPHPKDRRKITVLGFLKAPASALARRRAQKERDLHESVQREIVTMLSPVLMRGATDDVLFLMKRGMRRRAAINEALAGRTSDPNAQFRRLCRELERLGTPLPKAAEPSAHAWIQSFRERKREDPVADAVKKIHDQQAETIKQIR